MKKVDEVLGIAQVRARGEITIPEKARKFLELNPGDKIAIVYENGKTVFKKVVTSYEDFDSINEKEMN